MDALTDEQKAVHEELWRAWVRDGKLRHKAVVRRMKIAAAFVLSLLVVGSVIFINVSK